MTVHAMNCDAFDERLSDYLEDELSPSDRRAYEVHRASCLRCTALVRDLEGIRAEASVLPELTPTRDLWDAIAERIEAPVVPLKAPPIVVMPATRRPADRVRLAAIAAALIAVTAGVTYTLTIMGVGNGNPSGQIANVVAPDSGTSTDVTTAHEVAPANSERFASVDTAPANSNAPVPSVPTAQPVHNQPVSVTYSREIDRLRTVFIRNRSLLDPRTAAIIEANLKVIDEAIAQSKAALAQDPASRFLSDQLNSALDKKLELLRTAALLPQRT